MITKRIGRVLAMFSTEKRFSIFVVFLWFFFRILFNNFVDFLSEQSLSVDFVCLSVNVYWRRAQNWMLSARNTSNDSNLKNRTSRPFHRHMKCSKNQIKRNLSMDCFNCDKIDAYGLQLTAYSSQVVEILTMDWKMHRSNQCLL